MKMILLVAILLVLGAGILFATNKPKAKAVADFGSQYTPITSVSLEKFEVVDAKTTNPDDRKIKFTLKNHSNEGVSYVDVQLSGEGNNRFGLGFYTKGQDELKPNAELTLERMIRSKEPLTPVLRFIEFNGGRSEGDHRVGNRIATIRHVGSEVAKVYFDKLVALDSAADPLAEIATLRKQVRDDLLPLQGLDDLPAAKPEELGIREYQVYRRSALMDVLSELATLEQGFSVSTKKPEGLGARSAKFITRLL